MVGLSWTPFCCAKKLFMSYTYTPCSMGGLPCSPDESKQLTCTLVLSCQVHFCQTTCPVQNIYLEGSGAHSPGHMGPHRCKPCPCTVLQAAAPAQRHQWQRASPHGRCARTPAAPAGLPPWPKVRHQVL